jgi:hypothetical protein
MKSSSLDSHVTSIQVIELLKDFLYSIPSKLVFASLYLAFFLIGGQVDFTSPKILGAAIFVLVLIFFSDIIYKLLAQKFGRKMSADKETDND